jgi:hypothetical protein
MGRLQLPRIDGDGTADHEKRNLLQRELHWAHALNDTDGAPQNVACRSCEKRRASYDARHSFYAQVTYLLPLGHNILLRGWEIRSIASVRTGLPLTVTISRSATALPDGNSQNQRPDLVPGVSLTPPGGRTITQWINPAAFVLPPNGRVGQCREEYRGWSRAAPDR